MTIYHPLKFTLEEFKAMQQSLKNITLIVTLLILSACQSKPPIAVYNPKSDQDKAFVATPNYTLKEMDLTQSNLDGALRFRQKDKLKLSIWGHPELDHIAEIQANGQITFPVVGEIYAAKRTAAEIRTTITEKLNQLTRPRNPSLRFGDIVRLFVWQHQELSFTAVVQPQGTITLPMIGTLKVIDKPLDQLHQEINARLSKHIKNPKGWLIPEVQKRQVIQEPIISVLPIELTPQKATVIGEVLVQGQQIITPNMRVMDILANAKLKDEAELDSVVIIRNTDSNEPFYRKLALNKFLSGAAPLHNIYLQQGDVLIVPKTNIAKVGYFIDAFFSKTKPVFDWYLSAQSAAYYNSTRKLIEALNQAAKEAFEDAEVNPSIP